MVSPCPYKTERGKICLENMPEFRIKLDLRLKKPPLRLDRIGRLLCTGKRLAVNSNKYTTQLHKMSDAKRSVRRSKVNLFYNNVRPHLAQVSLKPPCKISSQGFFPPTIFPKSLHRLKK